MDKEKLLNMEWEEFCNYAESIGWTPAPPSGLLKQLS